MTQISSPPLFYIVKSLCNTPPSRSAARLRRVRQIDGSGEMDFCPMPRMTPISMIDPSSIRLLPETTFALSLSLYRFQIQAATIYGLLEVHPKKEGPTLGGS